MSTFLLTLTALAVMMAGLGAGLLAGRSQAPQRGCGKDCSCLARERTPENGPRADCDP